MAAFLGEPGQHVGHADYAARHQPQIAVSHERVLQTEHAGNM